MPRLVQNILTARPLNLVRPRQRKLLPRPGPSRRAEANLCLDQFPVRDVAILKSDGRTQGLGMDKALNEFVHHQNVAYFTRQLLAAPDVQCRRMLMKLLAEERSRARSNGWNLLQE